MVKTDKNIENLPAGSPEVCVVEASAGSGKTFALATRYLKLLFQTSQRQQDIQLRNILAITFTNKACIEMKARILKFLKQLALDKFDDPSEKSNILARTDTDAKTACAKAYASMEEIIRRYNYFQVQTIDSFINAILSGCAFKLELSSDFRIKNDYREYLAYSLDEIIDKASADEKIRERFSRFLDNYLHLENRKSWFPKKDITEIMGSLLAARNSYGLQFRVHDKSFKEIRAKREHIRELLMMLKENFPEGANGIYWGKFQKDFDASVGANQIDAYFNPFSHEEFKAKKNALIPPKTLSLWQETKSQISELYEWEALSRFNPYIEIFRDVEDNFRSACRQDDIMFLSELNSQARNLFLFGSISVPELYYRLATQFRHFLVDEFQDTSILQWKNIFPMVEEALASGGTMFYVGDKKQAIFRWRGGEVELMEYLKHQLKAFNVKESPLKDNYRSQKEIVEFNNAVFSADNICSAISRIKENKKSFIEFLPDDIADIRAIFSNSRQDYKPGPGNDRGYVKVTRIEARDSAATNELLKQEIFELIDGLKSRFRYRDIALICRTNDDVEMVTSWLIERKYPVESEKTLNIRENRLIKELIAFLTFLNSPIDDLAFATFILGDIFTRASGITAEKIRDFLFRTRSGLRHKSKPYLYRTFKTEFPQAWENFIDEFFKTVGFVPLYELVITILRKFSVLDGFAESQGFVMKFLEVVKAQEEDNQNISMFLEYFGNELPENLFVHVSSSDSIRVVTVHKSKGLEFPVVILPFFEINIRIGSGQSKKSAFVIDAAEEHLGLMYLKDAYSRFSPHLEKKYREEYKRAFIDELNNLYVSATRACLELYIYVPSKAGSGYNPAQLLIPEDKMVCGDVCEYPRAAEKKKTPPIDLGPSKYRDWIGYLKEEFEDIHAGAQAENIRFGSVLHCILSSIGDLSSSDPGLAVERAASRAKPLFPVFKKWGQALEIVDKLVNNTSTKSFFFVPDGRVYCEKEMVDKNGLIRRADRLIFKKDRIIVIDYKSARSKGGEYAGQLREYAQIVSGIYPGTMIECFLVYFDDLSVEEVKCQTL